MRILVALGLSISGAVALWPLGAAAGGFGSVDMGPRRTGMFAVMASPDDTTAIVHNPAGLAGQRGHRVQLSGTAFRLDVEAEFMCEPWMSRFDLYDSCVEREYSRLLRAERNHGVVPFLGASFDLHSMVENLVVAAAAYAPNIRSTALDEFSLGRFQGIESSIFTGQATAAAAYRPISLLSIGAGVSYVRLRAESWRRILFLGEEWDLKLLGDASAMQFHFGLLLEPARWISIGLGMDTGMSLLAEGHVKLAGVDHYDYERHQTEFYILDQETSLVAPYQLKVGVSYRPTGSLEIGFDFRFWRYSVSEEQMTILTAREDSHGMALLLDGYEYSLPQFMSDSHSFGLGLRYLVPALPVPLWIMGGVEYDKSPGNERYFTLEMPLSDSLGFSIGAKTRPIGMLSVGATWVHRRQSSVDITDSEASPPANLRASMSSDQLQLSVQTTF